MKSYQKKLWLLCLTLVIGSVMYAQEPVFRDLKGENAGSAENALEQRGYTHIKTNKRGYDVYAYWWNNRYKTCLCERVSNGEVKSIVKTDAFDCNKSTTGAVRHVDHFKHSRNDHENNQHFAAANQEDGFERGYLDGMYHKAYHNVYTGNKMIEAYAKGYEAGAHKRDKATSHHAGTGGYATTDFVDWKDLEHKDANDSYQKLKNRGFREIHSSNYNNATHKYFHSKNTGQCIEVEQRGRIIYRIQHYEGCNQYLD